MRCRQASRASATTLPYYAPTRSGSWTLAVAQGIEILGLTPHAACIKAGISTAWTIVDTWENGNQASSGRAYRDLIYAVYPGFEPSFADGNNGIHIIFLFDPTVGKERYLNAFSAIMDGRPAYDGKNLNQTLKAPKEAFAGLDDRLSIGKDNYLVIAPHPLQPSGLLSRPGHYIADLAGGHIHGAELRRDKTLGEDLADNAKAASTPSREAASPSITAAMPSSWPTPARRPPSGRSATALRS